MPKTNNRPVVLLVLAACCILLTSLLPLCFKTLFVEESGHYVALSPSIAIALFIAFLFNKSIARKLALFFCTMVGLFLLMILSGQRFADERSLWFLFLLLMQVLTILVLKDRQVRNFVRVQR